MDELKSKTNVKHPYYYKCPTGHMVPVNGNTHQRLQSGFAVNVVDHGEINADDWEPDHTPNVPT